MPYKLTMPDGSSYKIKDGVDPKEAVRAILIQQFKYDPEFDLKEETRKNTASQLKKTVEGMGTGSRLGAGYISGIEEIARKGANLLPKSVRPDWASDDAVRGQQTRDEALTGTTAGMIGSIGGNAAALAPLGAIGGVARGAAAASKGVPVLGSTLAKLAAKPIVAGLEGAAAGAIAGGPDQRGQGALIGALAGPALERVAAGMTRVGVRGLAKTTKAARELLDEMRSVGVKGNLPASLSIDPAAGPLSSSAKAFYQEFMGMMPITRGTLVKQGNQSLADFQETVLRRTYPRIADDVVRKFKESSMRDAIEFAERTVAGQKSANFTAPARRVLKSATHGQPKGVVKPKVLAKTVRSMEGGKGSGAQLLKIAEAGEEVFDQPLGKSTVFGRQAYHQMSKAARQDDAVGHLMNIAVNTFSLGGAIPRLLQSQGLQNAIVGQAGIQRALQKAMQSNSGRVTKELARELRVALSQMASDPENKERKDLIQEALFELERLGVPDDGKG